jgi:hypothetical protein
VDASGSDTQLWLAVKLTAALAGACLLGLVVLAVWLWLTRKRYHALSRDHSRLTRAVHGLCRQAAGATQTFAPDPTIVWDPKMLEQWRKETGPR